MVERTMAGGIEIIAELSDQERIDQTKYLLPTDHSAFFSACGGSGLDRLLMVPRWVALC